MKNPVDTVREKVATIFAELVGDRAKRLDGSVIAEPAMSAIAAAFIEKYGEEKAGDIGFHMADWNSGSSRFLVGDFSQFWQHAGEDFQSQVLLIAEAVGPPLDGADLVIDALDET